MGSEVFYAKPDALQGSLVETLKWARPTIFLAVPRVWEKFEDKLKEIAKTKPSVLQSISNWAKGHGLRKVKAGEKGEDPHYMYHVANYLILSRIKEAIGLDKAELFMFGAAPLKQSTIEYFASLDITLMNMYGLSETTGSATVSPLSKYKINSAGRSIKGGEIKIADPDEKGVGEIWIRGRHVMMGYFKNQEATKECIDKDGYFKSGDLGTLDAQGYLRITGRIKELIITAGGENVAPVPIEETFKQICPACSNIMLVGENQRFMGALITLKVDIDMTSGLPSKNLTQEAKEFLKNEAGVDVKSSEEAIKNQKVIELIGKCVE
jgi:long-chain-fatty-acid--CoA ligase ACSBG